MRKRLAIGSILAILVAVTGLAAIGLFAASNDGGTSSGIASIPDSGGLESTKGFPSSQDLSGTAERSSAGSTAKDAAPAAPSTAGGTSANTYGTTGSDGSGSTLPSLLDRKVILNATLGLGVNDVAAAFSEASRLTRSSGGYVEKSSYTGSDAADTKQHAASLTLRVPADQYDSLLAGLRGIAGAKVNSEGSKSSEVTEQYTDLQSRLRNLERTEQSYLKLLEQAKSIQDILTVNDRLDSVRAQIEQIQGRLNVLDKMTDLATIDLTLSPIVPGKAEPKTGGPKTFSEAMADAWEWSLDTLRYAAAGGAVALVALGWLFIPLVALALLVRRWRHRRPQPAPQPPATATQL